MTKRLYLSSEVETLQESGVPVTPSKNWAHPFLCKFIVYCIQVINGIPELDRLFPLSTSDRWLPLLGGRTEHLTCTSNTLSFCHNSVSRSTPGACGEPSVSVYHLWCADNICKPVGLRESSRVYYRCIGLLNVNIAASVFGGGLGISCITEKIKVIWL